MGNNSSRVDEDEFSIPISRDIKTGIKLPHNFETIMQDADVQLGRSSMDHLYEQLHEGIFLNNKRKKYWIDKAKHNCFIVYARDLTITWSLDGRFWTWLYDKDIRHGEVIEVAKLENVCWLEVHGKMDMSKLSPNVLYEVSFVIKMTEEPGYGWEVPVNLRIMLPGGKKLERKVNLMEKPRGQWIKIFAGEFATSSRLNGEMEFSLYEYEGGNWKRGLIVKGVTIQPKY